MKRIEADSPEVKALKMSPGDVASYPIYWLMPGGVVCGLHRLIHHWTIRIDLCDWGYEDSYCFATRELAEEAFDEWNGETGEPKNWHRHPSSGRRRELATGREWVRV